MTALDSAVDAYRVGRPRAPVKLPPRSARGNAVAFAEFFADGGAAVRLQHLARRH